MELHFNDILNFLKKYEIRFHTPYTKDKKYVIASFYEIVENGFYFFDGSITFPNQLKNSLVLAKSDFKEEYNSSNLIIFLEGHNPKEIFYLILTYFFPQKSTGIISKTSIIHPKASIGRNVQIDDFCVIDECVIKDNVIIGSHTKVYKNSIINENSIIESMSLIGTRGVAWAWDSKQENKILQPQIGGVEIGMNCFLGGNSIIVRGSLNENTTIGNSTFLAPSCRIGHGTKVGNHVHLANNVVTGGNAIIGDYSFVGSNVTIRPKVVIHSKTIIGIGAVVINNTSDINLTLMGVPANEFKSKDNPAGMPIPKK